jgi:hypothetical protein
MTRTSAGSITAEPTALIRTGEHIRSAATVARAAAVDPDLVTGTTVGHRALDDALQRFTTEWNRNLNQLHAHIDDLGELVRQAGAGYHDGDTATAESFHELDRLHDRA